MSNNDFVSLHLDICLDTETVNFFESVSTPYKTIKIDTEENADVISYQETCLMWKR